MPAHCLLLEVEIQILKLYSTRNIEQPYMYDSPLLPLTCAFFLVVFSLLSVEKNPSYVCLISGEAVVSNTHTDQNWADLTAAQHNPAILKGCFGSVERQSY